MKGNFKLLFILLFAIIVVVAGCSDSDSASESDNSNDSGSEETDEAAAEETDEPMEISIAAGTNQNTVATSTSNINEERYVLELEERTNVDLDFQLFQQDNIREAIGLMFAGGDIPDILHTQQGMLPLDPSMAGSVEAGVFMPLNDLLEEHGQTLLEEVPQEAWDEVSVDGNIYAIPQYLSTPSRRGLLVRGDLMEEYGIENPETVDDFLEMLRVFKENGHEAPFDARSGFSYSQAIFGAYDVMFGNNMFEVVDDQVVPKFMDVENMTAALETWKTMYEEGLVPPDFPSHGSSERGQNIAAGNTVVYEANASGILGQHESVKENIGPDASMDVIPSPVGPDGKGGNMLYSSTLRLNYVNAEVDEAKAEAIIKFFDWMVTEEGKEFFSFGVEGEDFERDSNGDVIYEEPETEEESNQQVFRVGWLSLVGDQAFDEQRMSVTENGEKVFEAMETIDQEGREGISFVEPLEAYSINPDIMPGFDTAPKIIEDGIIQIIYGERPLDDWQGVIDEWLDKGGDEVIKEATEDWNNQENIFRVGPDANVE